MQVSDDKFEEQAARDGTFPNLAPFLICVHVHVVKFAASSVLLRTFCLVSRQFDRAFSQNFVAVLWILLAGGIIKNGREILFQVRICLKPVSC